MTINITCIRCGTAGEQIAAPPLPGDLGGRIYSEICHTCWQEWLQHQTALINHYALNLAAKDARQFLTEQTESFLFAQQPKDDG
ncbi:MAG: oxidative damage protection protein [Gemmatimonadales bacterium]